MRDPYTKAVEAREFRAKCRQLLNDLTATGKPAVTTMNGRPVAQLVPVGSRRTTPAGLHRGWMRIAGGIVAPTNAAWKMLR